MQTVGSYKTKEFTAYFYPTKIIICTTRQSFRIVCAEYPSIRPIRALEQRIRSGRIENIYQLPNNEELTWQVCTRPVL